MLPRTPEVLVLFTVLSACTAGLVCPAQQAQPVAPVRYHFGDDPGGKLGWANPNFDDSSWPVAQNGHWPMPYAASGDVAWVRVRVPVRSDASGNLAVHITQKSLPSRGNIRMVVEAFVNGHPVAQLGSFPPHADVSLSAFDFVSDLAPRLAVPGETAIVVLRTWYPPFMHAPDAFATAGVDIDESRDLHLAARADRLAILLSIGPDIALNVFIASMGVGLLVFWRWTRSRELLFASGMLISTPALALFNELMDLGLVATSWRIGSWIVIILGAACMAVTLEFIWATHGLKFFALKRLAQAALVVANATYGFLRLATVHSPLLWSALAIIPSFRLFALIGIVVNLWAFVFVKGNRLIAAAFLLVPITVSLGLLGAPTSGTIGPFHVVFFNLAFFLSALAMFVTLGQRAWHAWRARDELRVEFEAAREVQQQLVAPAVDVPGFRIESVYAPAKQVGGDFFGVVPESDDGLLVVVGDVSGKGLSAAMTMSAIIGALRSIPPVSPAWILNALNSGLVGNLHGGLVTCCSARITHDGRVTIANAGHLSPYRNEVELEVCAGLPLGIDPNCEHEESHFLLQPDERLTFVSDGVVEARNTSGELFGFERMQRIANSGTRAIAQAAVEFGQNDDITVLSVTRTVGLNPALQ
jgi:sigma-B regulation protein RsbU (phosphoserine phosphatase)